MNLTFEVTENGYKILDGGRVWIVQDGFIPFPATTLAESAELHIAELIKANTPINTTPVEEELEKLKEKQALMQKALDDLLLGGAL